MCLTGAVLYALNRWLLKPHGVGGAITHDYLNDMLCLPLFVPTSLGLQRVLGVRRNDDCPHLWEILQHWAVFSVVFEILLPLFPEHFSSTSDVIDVLAYLGGGLLSWLLWAWAFRGREMGAS